MVAELISVGTEILLGEILNTDAQFLSEQLSILGIDVYHQSVVGDNPKRLSDSLRVAFDRSDIVICSGGLGPTPDDLTKEVIAEFMGKELCLHKESLERMTDYFKKVNRKMPEINKKQSMMPKDSIILKNTCGTAPGCIIEKDGKAMVMLPGPPNELTAMFTKSVLPYLESKNKNKLFTKTLHLFGVGESAVAAELLDLMENSTNPTVAPYAKTGEVYLRLGAKAQSQEEAFEIMKKAEKVIYDKFGEFVYSTNGESLPKVVFNKLVSNKMTISTAESCTGGLIAKTITDFVGSSEIFNEGYITYSNDSKVKNLGVNQATIDKFGVVSTEVCEEMADGVRTRANSDIGIGVSGIAGPGGATENKPVGTVMIAVASDKKIISKKLSLNGDRERVRYLTMLNVFDLINKEFI